MDDSTPNFSGFGGVIIFNNDGTRAIGIYSSTTRVGGVVKYFDLWDVSCLSISKLSAVFEGPISASDNIFTMYLVVGALIGVRRNMRQLFLLGIH